jgi:hypothetical protein
LLDTIEKLHQLVQETRDRIGTRTDVILAGDFNRHDQLWGGDDVSPRRQGEADPIINFMSDHSLNSVLLREIIYLHIRNTDEAGENPFRNRVKRVTSYLFHNLILTRDCTETEEVFHDNKIRYLDIFYENSFLYNDLIGNGKCFLKSILFYR